MSRIKKRTFILITLLVAILLFGIAYRISERRLLPFLIHRGIELTAPTLGFQLENADVHVRFGQPIVITNLSLKAADTFPLTNTSKLHCERLEIAFQNLWELLDKRERLFSRLRLNKVTLTLDLRREHLPPPTPADPHLETPSFEEATQEFRTWRRYMLLALPLQINLQESDLLLLTDQQRFSLTNLNLKLNEDALGELKIAQGEIQTDPIHILRNNIQAKTAWKNGGLYLSGLELAPGIIAEDIYIHALRQHGPAITIESIIHNGWLRCDLNITSDESPPILHLSVWGEKIPVAPTLTSLELPWQASGELKELFLSFHGNTNNLLEGQTNLHLEANDFLYQKRGWKNLSLAAKIQSKKIQLERFLLTQDKNKVNAKGNLQLLPNTPLQASDFSLQADADIRHLSALTNLIGDLIPLDDTEGQVRMQASFQQKNTSRKGQISLQSDQLHIKNIPLGKITAEAKINADDLTLETLKVDSTNTQLQAKGDFQISTPHRYSGELQLEVKDLTPYLALIAELTAEPATKIEASLTDDKNQKNKPLAQQENLLKNLSGALTLDWHGDGVATAHSGAFDLSLNNLKTPELPTGLKGQFIGTYSPENLYLSKLELLGTPLRLDSVASIGKKGINITQLTIKAREKKLAIAEIYLPWNPYCLLQGQDWQSGILQDQDIYALIKSAPLELEHLFDLIGKNAPLSGKLDLQVNASGKINDPNFSASLKSGEIHINESKNRRGPLLLSKTELGMTAENGIANIDGKIFNPNIEPITLKGSLPFGVVTNQEGQLQIADPDGDLKASLHIPKTDLSRFKSLLGPQVRQFHGNIEGNIDFTNRLSKPIINGVFLIDNVSLAFFSNLPRLQNFGGKILFDGTKLKIDQLGGSIGAGPFALNGTIDIEEPKTPKIDLRLNGTKVLLIRNSLIRLRSDLDIRIAGQGTNGSINGEIGLINGSIYKRLELTPLLSSAKVDGTPPPLLPSLAGFVPKPFGSWKADIRIRNKTPFVLAGNLATGDIIPEIDIKGTLADPRPIGKIQIQNIQGYLPFTTLYIPDGYIYLREKYPRIPLLDIKGSAEAANYSIQMVVYGPMDEPKFFLRSNPPLPQDQLVLLMTTGIMPGTENGGNFGQAAMGQGGLLALKMLARQFDTKGVDVDNIINRLNIYTTPPDYLGEDTGIHGEYKVTNSFSIFSEKNGSGYYDVGLSYQFNFR
ncbi:MAG: translocation/assembly module TamB domain-containing protein [Chthoniobacterales bacterium]